MIVSPTEDAKQIIVNIKAKLDASQANNATFDYVMYQAASGYNAGSFLEVREIFEQYDSFETINKQGTYEQRRDLADTVWKEFCR